MKSSKSVSCSAPLKRDMFINLLRFLFSYRNCLFWVHHMFVREHVNDKIDKFLLHAMVKLQQEGCAASISYFEIYSQSSN